MTRARDLAAFVSNADGDIKFDTDTLFIDSSANKVGLGTTTPSQMLTLSDGTFAINGTSSFTSNVEIGRVGGDNNMAFATGGTERVRIDTSGNLLVGRTSVGATGNGHSIRGGDSAIFSRDASGETMQIGRNANDGELVRFLSNGSTVGNIKSDSGKLVVNSNGSNLVFAVGGTVELNTDGTQFYPQTDDSHNLGISSNRFKDLYLSGGAFIGGTSSTNRLDDYEEGTFTPAISGLTFSAAQGQYVKVGQIVYVSINLQGSNTSKLNQTIDVTGLPFTGASNAGGDYPANSIPIFENSNISLASGYTNMYGRIQSSTSFMQLLQSQIGTHAAMNAGGGLNSSATIRCSFTYRTA